VDAALIDEGDFYPRRSMSADARLRWYARFFDTVEVNSGYYAIPDVRNAQLWTARTPDGFLFNVKAYSLLTGHHPKPQTLPAALQRLLPARPKRTPRGEIEHASFGADAMDVTFALFRAALEPLATARKLGYVLFQFAPWVHFDDGWLEYVRRLPAHLPGGTVAVEFRHRSWFPEHAVETLEALRAARLVHTIVDGPTEAGSVPRITTATAPIALFRLHGRNVEGFRRQLRGEEPAVREKYDYLYTEPELREFASEVEQLEEETERIFISFNNNNRSYPVRNALAMKRLLGQRVDVPPALAGPLSGDLFA
jgi:uncharacterized protein YecE (DUF72 family)